MCAFARACRHAVAHNGPTIAMSGRIARHRRRAAALTPARGRRHGCVAQRPPEFSRVEAWREEVQPAQMTHNNPAGRGACAPRPVARGSCPPASRWHRGATGWGCPAGAWLGITRKCRYPRLDRCRCTRRSTACRRHGSRSARYRGRRSQRSGCDRRASGRRYRTPPSSTGRCGCNRRRRPGTAPLADGQGQRRALRARHGRLDDGEGQATQGRQGQEFGHDPILGPAAGP